MLFDRDLIISCCAVSGDRMQVSTRFADSLKGNGKKTTAECCITIEETCEDIKIVNSIFLNEASARELIERLKLIFEIE